MDNNKLNWWNLVSTCENLIIIDCFSCVSKLDCFVCKTANEKTVHERLKCAWLSEHPTNEIHENLQEVIIKYCKPTMTRSKVVYIRGKGWPRIN